MITGNPLAIGLTLSGAIWFGSKASGGHFNPAVNYMMLIAKKMNATAALYYYKSLKR